MAISGAEIGQIFSMMGLGKFPASGGPSSNYPLIAQTTPFEIAVSNTVALSTGVAQFSAIYLLAGTTITNINYISVGAESGGSHLWFALYDDGRGSTSSAQFALLQQTSDQTGAAAFAANTNLGLSLITPYTTTYTGIYYVAIMCAGTTPTLMGSPANGSTGGGSPNLSSTTNSYVSFTAGAGLTNAAANPSGTVVSAKSIVPYAYLS